MQSIFERHENKYLISKEQGEAFKKILARHMEPDSTAKLYDGSPQGNFGEYLVQNIYYDNESWEVIRRSIEKPLYKEKMRLRCYGIPDRESRVFLELKKKYKGVVYKRRAAIPYYELSFKSPGDIISEQNSQILRELNFYMVKTQVMERVYITYKRTAFTGIDQKGLRVTFDADLRFRLGELNFLNPNCGTLLLPKDMFVMEIKALGSMPLWLAHALCEHRLFPAPFSKYGRCYTDFIIKQPEVMLEMTQKIKKEEKISA